jgi:hypothetical protein
MVAVVVAAAASIMALDIGTMKHVLLPLPKGIAKESSSSSVPLISRCCC